MCYMSTYTGMFAMVASSIVFGYLSLSGVSYVSKKIRDAKLTQKAGPNFSQREASA